MTSPTPIALGPRDAARVDALFDTALDLDDAGRAALIAATRAEDAALGDALSLLLAATGQSSPLDLPLLDRVDPPALPKSGDDGNARFGPWRALAHAGRGGMAEVFLAERADGAYQSRAALKLLDSADPRSVVRFERERALLAALDHPRIARLLDGGTTADGRLWFATAWIDGADLDVWLAAERPSLAARLALFDDIAEAVAHAHRQLVIHRDLKPGNVRVSREGRAVLLDFGIAQITAPEHDAAAHPATRTAMTPEYAAPEQITAGAVGTWTDVHGLGVLLYEMLSGRHPFPAAGDSLAAAVQSIVHDTPPPPSRVAAASLPYPTRALVGDLDAIVLACLAKAPVRRYPSVDALRDDLARHRRLLPVVARRGARLYRARRFMRRNWLPAGLGAALVAASVAGVAAVIATSREVAAERDAATLEVRRQEALREHLMLVFREGAGQGGVSAQQLLDASAAQLDTLYGSDPALRRSVLLAMGELYFVLGDYPASRSMLERFLDAADASTPLDDRVLAEIQLTQVLLRAGEITEARAMLAAAAARHRVDPARPRDLDAQLVAAQSAEARARGNLAAGLALQREAVRLTRIAIDRSPQRVAIAESNLGMALLQANRLEPAKVHLAASLDAFADAGYARSVHAITTLGNLANVETLLGDLDQAERHYREASTLALTATAESASMAALKQNHARLMLLRGRLDEAHALALRAEALATRFVGADSLDVAGIRTTRAEITLARGDYADAKTLIDSAAAGFAARLPPAHPLNARARLVGASIELAEAPDGGLGELVAAVDALASAPPLLARHMVRGSVMLAGQLLRRGDADAARRALERAAAHPVHAELPAFERAELVLWRAATTPAAARDAVAIARNRARLADALGASHPRVTVIDAALDAPLAAAVTPQRSR